MRSCPRASRASGSGSPGPVRFLALEAGCWLEAATFLSGLAVGTTSAWMARSSKAPVAVMAFAGAVTMVPGLSLYRALGGALHLARQADGPDPGTVARTLGSAFQGCLVVSGLTLGLILGARMALALVGGRDSLCGRVPATTPTGRRPRQPLNRLALRNPRGARPKVCSRWESLVRHYEGRGYCLAEEGVWVEEGPPHRRAASPEDAGPLEPRRVIGVVGAARPALRGPSAARPWRLIGVVHPGWQDIDWAWRGAWLYFKAEKDLKKEGSQAPVGPPERLLQVLREWHARTRRAFSRMCFLLLSLARRRRARDD
jgi:uncharacterized membrane protein YjjB (DUF3815 family)